jgi:hypothetical protein
MTHEDAYARLPELVGLRAATQVDPGLDAHVAACARCQERLRRLRAVDSGLRALEATPAVPARLERRVLAIPAGGEAQGHHRGGGRGWLVAAAAAGLALIAAIAVGIVLTGGDPAPSGEFRAERVVRLGGPRVAAAAEIQIGRPEGNVLPMRLVATGLPHGGGRYYGVWLTGPRGAVSGGSFMPDGEGRCVVMLRIPPGDWSAIDITAGDRPPSARSTVASGAL